VVATLFVVAAVAAPADDEGWTTDLAMSKVGVDEDVFLRNDIDRFTLVGITPTELAEEATVLATE
jgi:hypothetical protein